MKPPSILVVEDEQIVAMDLRATLRRLGYAVPAIASSGDEAIQKASEYRPDLMLMDIRLEGPMDGIQAAEHIRADFDVPVIYVTAHTDQETQQRARQTAPYGYLVKPFDERMLQTTIDITIERHRRDRQTKASEQRLLTTLVSIGDAVLITDAAGRITFLNPIAEELIRCSAPEVIGHPVDDVMQLIDTETRVPIDHPVRAALRTGDQVLLSVETTLVAEDGTEISIDDTAAPIRAVDGRIEGVVMVFRDATLRGRLAEAKQYAHLRLLAGGIAHDLNNLLMTVIGNTELAQLDLDEHAPVQETLQQIEAAARRATDLTQHLLAYIGRSRIVLEPIDLNALVKETILLLSSGPLKHVIVRKKLWADLPHFEADPTRIQQAVQNLLINAAEAIGEQIGTITVTTTLRHLSAAELTSVAFGAELRSGPYVALEIADTGCGMDTATRESIFQPLFTTKFTGRGLGIAAVLGVVREHRGAILVTSAPNQGTTFAILLPYAPVGKLATVPPPLLRTTWRSAGTVLVVDDEASVRSSIAHMIEHLGLRVLTAADWYTALEVCRTHLTEIDCVLLDLTMPGKPSTDVARMMHHLHPRLPIILMSGYSLGDVAQSLPEVPWMQFLSKPFEFADLLTVLQRVFAMSDATHEMG